MGRTTDEIRKKIQIKENDDFYINGIVLEIFPPIKQEDSL